MNFLESAEILMPALTGIALTIYDGTFDTLEQFENHYCFSPQLQQIYTAKYLEIFLKSCVDGQIHDLVEPLGTRLATLKLGHQWLLLGPYVEKGWNNHSARTLFAELGISVADLPRYRLYRCGFPIVQQELVAQTAFLLAEYFGSESKMPETVQLRSDSKISVVLSDVYSKGNAVNQRHQVEDHLITAVSQGDSETVRTLWTAAGPLCIGWRFLSDSIQDQLVKSAIVRTLVRIGAKQGGLSPMLIDAIFREYIQKMIYTTSEKDLDRLTYEMTMRICDEVRKRQRSNWSHAVRIAVDYIQVNLSKPMTVAEIAQAAGVDRHRLSKDFIRETGKTIKQYLSMRRCEVAAELLLDSSTSIQEIAECVGYEDTSYFSRVFKKNQGMTPHIYRDSHGTSL